MELNLADLLESVAAAIGDREAVVCPASDAGPGRRLTYRELDERADRLAHVLAARGVGRDDTVALVLRNGNEYLEAMFASFKLRAVPVNVNHRSPAADLAAVIADSRAGVVLHEPDLGPAVAEAAPGLPTLSRGPAWEAAIATAPGEPVHPERSGDDRYVLYTGGTTKRPRGVVWRHEDVCFAALGVGGPDLDADGEDTDPGQVARLGRHDQLRCLPASPFMHGTGHWIALATLLRGGTVVALREAFDAAQVLDVVAAESVTSLGMVGDAFGRPIVDALERRADTLALTSLNVVLSGGATLSPTTKADLLRLLPWAIVVDAFGASETGGQGQQVTYPGSVLADKRRFTMGADTTVVDGDVRPLRPGDGRVGWLARCGHVPLGYLGDPEGSASIFPVVDGVRWAVPGDRAGIEADGTIVVHGRGSSTISSGGEKVHAEEVELALRAHPDVVDAVVVGVHDRRWGEVVTAVVALRPGTTLTVRDAADHCRSRLAGYKLPRRLVVVDEVVRTASGKTDIRWAKATATATATA